MFAKFGFRTINSTQKIRAIFSLELFQEGKNKTKGHDKTRFKELCKDNFCKVSLNMTFKFLKCILKSI